jgi:hypothetical protein
VSDVPPAGFPSNSGPQWGPPPPAAFQRPSRWPTLVALAVGLIGVAVGFVGWFRPAPHDNSPPAKPTYTAEQVAGAKTKVCTEFGKLDRAVGVNNALPRGSDPVVAAVNSRQIFDVFSRHLLATLAEEPATPADLAAAVREQASTLEDAVIGDEDGFSNSDPELRPVVDANSASAEKIRRLCK